jgi:hypothetical protein
VGSEQSHHGGDNVAHEPAMSLSREVEGNHHQALRGFVGAPRAFFSLAAPCDLGGLSVPALARRA